MGCYIWDEDTARYTPGVIDVLTLQGDKIAAVTGFLMLATTGLDAGTWPAGEEVFPRFGLPAELS